RSRGAKMRIDRTAWAAAFSLTLAGCNGTSSYLDATGTPGRDEATLGTWLTVVACVVVAIVGVAVLAGIARHRAEHNEPWRDASERAPERREIRSGLNWIFVGLAMTFVVLVATFAGTMVTLDAATRPRHSASLILDVIGHQWWWEVRYR